MQNGLFGEVGPVGIDFDKELNEEQLRVVKNGDGPCVVLAGAGSGKTRTIVHRVAWMIAHGVAPEGILLLTFTNKAAEEMRMRIGQLLDKMGAGTGQGKLAVWAGTFHSTANRILRGSAERVGFTSSFSILDDDDSKELLKAAMKQQGFAFDGKKFPSPGVVRDLLSYSKNALVTIEKAIEKKHPSFDHHAESIWRIGDAYTIKKKNSNAMDFDDLLVHLFRLLESDPVFRDRLASRFTHILVDEYQDTNPLQAALIDRILGPSGNLLVVGDDAQSIYSFRAADVRNILDFPKRHPGAKIFTLETNYRSTPEILDLANDVISRNIDQYDKQLKSVMQPYVKPAVVPKASASQEAAFIVGKVRELIESGVQANEIAVLFRATFHSQTLEFELARHGIAYDYRGGLKFFDRAHIKDALAFLRVAANYADEAAWMRVLLLQEGIGEVAAGKVLAALRSAGSLAGAVLAPISEMFGARVAKGWENLRGVLEEVHAANAKPSVTIRAVLGSSYIEYLENEYPNWKERSDDLEQLATFAEGYDSAADMLAEITLDATAATQGKGDRTRRVPHSQQIVLSTIHQSKGLEWDSVFVIHLTNSGFPNKRALGEQGGLEEERRLFYVACTRAKRNLFLTYPMTMARDAFGNEQPSLFIEEADPHLLDLSAAETGMARPYGKLGKPKNGWGGDDSDSGGFFEEESVNADPDLPPDPFADVKKRMGGVKRNFLRDV